MLARRYNLTALVIIGLLFGFRGPASSQTSDPNLPEVPLPLEVVRLKNGIRLIHLPQIEPRPPGQLIDITFGYTVGLRDEEAYGNGLLSILTTYLEVSIPARTLALASHFAGGQVNFVRELDLVGMRLQLPATSAEVVLREIVAYFAHDLDMETLEYARVLALEKARGDSNDFRTDIYDHVRQILFSDHPYHRRPLGHEGDIDRVELDQLRAFYSDSFGTNRAFVISSDPVSRTAVDALSGVKTRSSSYTAVAQSAMAYDATMLEFPSRPIGGVILATAIPSVHFRDWYVMLALDSLIRRVVSPDAVLEFSLAEDPFFHRLELDVEIPEYVEDVRDNLLQEIDQLQYRSATPDLLNSVKSQALGFLARRTTAEWFAAHDLSEVLDEGRAIVRNLNADELRSAARDMLLARRVVAMWAPAFTEPSVEVESLSNAAEVQPASDSAIRKAPGHIDVPLLAPKALLAAHPIQVERLESGITLASSEQYGVFVEGVFNEELLGGNVSFGSNGVLWSFDWSPTADILEMLRQVRPDRILIFVPETEMNAARQRFTDWTSGRTDSSPSRLAGSVSTGDIPSLLTLKMWLDGKLIEAGWFDQVTLRIDGLEGARLLIETDAEREAQVREWIREVAQQGISEDEFVGARRAAVGYFNRIRPDLQILLWQRDPLGLIRSPTDVTLSRLRTVSRIYF